jgi:tetratricopeptide (TPR) repeat protein
MSIEVLPGERTAPAVTREQRAWQAIERSRRQVDASPNSAQACNGLAWALVTAPEPLRDAEEAVALAEKAVGLACDNAAFRNTLGAAYYRAGRYREAVETLRPNLEEHGDGALAFDLFFLAMGYQRLGETARARDYYDWAVRWVEVQRRAGVAPTEELTTFRAEAAELLGIERESD